MFQVLVGTIVVKEGKILLVKERKQGISGLLNIPAGHLEQGESLVDGAKRELKEETGLDVQIKTLVDFEKFEARGENYLWFIFGGEITSEKQKQSELEYDFYDINYIREHTELLRDQKVLPKILNNFDKNRNVIEILK